MIVILLMVNKYFTKDTCVSFRWMGVPKIKIRGKFARGRMRYPLAQGASCCVNSWTRARIVGRGHAKNKNSAKSLRAQKGAKNKNSGKKIDKHKSRKNIRVFFYFLRKCLMMSMTSPRMMIGITTCIGGCALDLLISSHFVVRKSVSNVEELGVKFKSISTLATIVSSMSVCFLFFICVNLLN
jgi:hypothetical protein